MEIGIATSTERTTLILRLGIIEVLVKNAYEMMTRRATALQTMAIIGLVMCTDNNLTTK